MKKAMLISLSILMMFTGCGKNQPKKDSDDDGRSLASVVQGASKDQILPLSTVKFLLKEEQRLKPQQAIKHYSSILPEDMYQRLLKMSHNVDDLGFSVTRKDNEMILDNGKDTLKITFLGSVDHLTILLDGEHFDFAKAQSVERLMQKLESNINGTTKTSSLSPLYRICPALGLLGASEAQASNWFTFGGLAILGVAIAFAAYYIGKSVQNAKVKVSAEAKLDQKTQDALNKLADSIKDADVNVNLDTNHTIKVETPEEATGLF